MKRSHIRTLRELILFAMLGAIMFTSKLVMEALPNIHLVGALTMAYTIVYRAKALAPIYVYVALTGLYLGFAPGAWEHNLYIWAVLWGTTMLLPQRIPRKVAKFVYPAVCCLHGLFFGVLSAPVYAILFGLNFEQTLIYIAKGIGFDITHAIGNLVAGVLVLPVSELLLKLEKSAPRSLRHTNRVRVARAEEKSVEK